MEFKPTKRGFYVGSFKDDYNCDCSLQESSSVVPHIWLGMDADASGEAVGITVDGHKLGARMHLNVEQVAMLIPPLKFFVQNKRLPDKDETPEDDILTADERRLIDAFRDKNVEQIVRLTMMRIFHDEDLL